MEHIVVLTGAGISAESGLKTFRDSGGLWEEHSVYEVATPDAWARDPYLVTRFYNLRREQLYQVQPNAGHLALAALEEKFKVTVVTQNVDDLHERAGSTHVVHLHGELSKVRSSIDPNLIYEWGNRPVLPGDVCEKGTPLRPHVVWFGEEVTAMPLATEICSAADHFWVVGTSLNVYPAAGLLYDVPARSPIVLVDPADLPIRPGGKITHLREKASVALPRLVKQYLGED